MKKRLDSLQALKALACLIVFANHAGIPCAGTYTMCIFFMVSGLTMVYGYLDRPDRLPSGFVGTLRFAAKKVLKLYPLYILCMLPVMALDLLDVYRAPSAEALLFFAKKLVASLFLVQSWVPDSRYAMAFNGVAWFLSTTMFLYFCFPFILRLVRKCRGSGGALIWVLALVAGQFALGFAAGPIERFLLRHSLIIADGKFAYWFTYIFPPMRVIDFAIGCFVGLIFLEHRERELSPRAAAALDIVTVLAWVPPVYIYWCTDSFLTGEAFRYTQLFMPASILTVYAYARGLGPVVRLLTNRATLFISSISSDFFLLHQNIIRFSILFLSMAAVPFSAIRVIVPVVCFVLTVIACLIWARLEGFVKARLKRG